MIKKFFILCSLTFFALSACNFNNNSKHIVTSMPEKLENEKTNNPIAACQEYSMQLDSSNIMNTIQNICSNPRPFGSEEEKRTLDYLDTQLISYGYQTSIQSFPIYQNISTQSNLALRKDDTNNILGYGSNLIASLDSNIESNKSLIVSAHHDTTDDTVGLFDNASGVATILEVARLISQNNLPFDMKFIFFGAEEEGCIGSREYLENLTETEKNKMIGCINVDMVGEKLGGELTISTRYSRPNALSLLLNNHLNENGSDGLILDFCGLSDDHYMFKNNIPAFTISNKHDMSLANLSYSEQLELFDLKIPSDTAMIIVDFILSLKEDQIKAMKSQPYISTSLSSPNITFIQSLLKIENLTLSDFALDSVDLKLIQQGASSELICTFSNATGKKYVISQIPIEYFSQETIDTMEIYKNNDLTFYTLKTGDDTMKIIFKDPLNFYYYNITGNITIQDILLFVRP